MRGGDAACRAPGICPQNSCFGLKIMVQYNDQKKKEEDMFGVLKGYENRQDPDLMNEIVLAYLGDCVYELYVRNLSVASGKIKTRELSRISAEHSKAAFQARAMKALEGQLTEAETQVMKRARNKRITSKPKNAEPMEYKLATAFEAVIGYLYVKGEFGRMEWLIERALTKIPEEKKDEGEKEERE